MKLDQQLGVNPYKFGMVGSTDAHTGLATAEEDKFFGKTSSSEPSATRANHPFVRNPKTGLTIFGWETVASGYAGSGRPKTRGRPSGTRCSGANFDGIQVVKGWLDAKGADYARGLEIPTPRWTAYDAKYFNVKMAKEVAMFGQDRAYTSPIWYTPGK